eukprot:TRINITY_DN1772_c0_g1_i1.p1 TRINITY_DN1772_c0_g1~~TRINITY_DN1772_c0_g1_i1.p1  ORF type:complete len:699 (+),score=69.07 TRINITY_DN1772_c0_g1_i1:97-2193(+)
MPGTLGTGASPSSRSASPTGTGKGGGKIFRALYDDALSRMTRQRQRQFEKESQESLQAVRQHMDMVERLRAQRRRWEAQQDHIEEGVDAHLWREEAFLQQRELWRQRRAVWQETREFFEEMAECTFAPTLYTNSRRRADTEARQERVEAERRSLEDPPEDPASRRGSRRPSLSNRRRSVSRRRSRSCSARSHKDSYQPTPALPVPDNESRPSQCEAGNSLTTVPSVPNIAPGSPPPSPASPKERSLPSEVQRIGRVPTALRRPRSVAGLITANSLKDNEVPTCTSPSSQASTQDGVKVPWPVQPVSLPETLQRISPKQTETAAAPPIVKAIPVQPSARVSLASTVPAAQSSRSNSWTPAPMPLPSKKIEPEVSAPPVVQAQCVQLRSSGSVASLIARAEQAKSNSWTPAPLALPSKKIEPEAPAPLVVQAQCVQLRASGSVASLIAGAEPARSSSWTPARLVPPPARTDSWTPVPVMPTPASKCIVPATPTAEEAPVAQAAVSLCTKSSPHSCRSPQNMPFTSPSSPQSSFTPVPRPSECVRTSDPPPALRKQCSRAQLASTSWAPSSGTPCKSAAEAGAPALLLKEDSVAAVAMVAPPHPVAMHAAVGPLRGSVTPLQTAAAPHPMPCRHAALPGQPSNHYPMNRQAQPPQPLQTQLSQTQLLQAQQLGAHPVHWQRQPPSLQSGMHIRSPQAGQPR